MLFSYFSSNLYSLWIFKTASWDNCDFWDTPGGLQGKPYLDALEARKEAIARVTAEIENDDAVLMTGPTSIMHFCGLPTVTVAGEMKDPNGVNEAVILYGKDEYRLYEAALAIEQMMKMT